jgi:hypothetical protein
MCVWVYTFYRRLMGPSAVLEECAKRRLHQVSIFQTPMPVASRSAEYVIPAHHEEDQHLNLDMTLVSLLKHLDLQVFPTFRKLL